MAQGDFTKEEARRTMESVREMFDAISYPLPQMEHLGHLNDVMLFLSAAEKNAPSELKEASG